MPDGRFAKYTAGCHCRMCQIGRYVRKFRNKKHRVYRELDKIERLAN
jgi:hypothetical protein